MERSLDGLASVAGEEVPPLLDLRLIRVSFVKVI